MTDFGKDVWCAESRRTGRYATGTRIVAQRCLHRLITPRGELRGGEDEENFGENLTQYVGSVDDSTVQRTLPAKVIAELRKDEQVESVVVTLESTKASNGETTWTSAIDVESSVGPFQLVLSVDSVTTKLLGITT